MNDALLDFAVDATRHLQVACTIERGTHTDAGELSAFAARTYLDTYAHYARPEKLHRHVDAAFAPARQAEELADPQTATLLARRGCLAAFAQVRRSDAPPCVDGAFPVELHRFYVDRCWHGRGVSQQLLAEVRRAATALGGATLWLKVWEHNARAIAFYRKSGFVDVGVSDFFLHDDRLTDRVLVTSLASPLPFPRPAGTAPCSRS